MNIGILTVPFNNNYGGFLQAFALKTVLKQMGHDVIFINRKRDKKKSLKFKLYYLLIKFHLIDDYLEKRIQKLSVNTNQFKEKYLFPITEEYNSSVELKKCINLGIDFFVVGSDQVWRYNYALDSINDYYFNFLEESNIPRISYAASFGTDEMEYPEDKIEISSKLLKYFKGISVREQSARELLEKHFDVPSDSVKVVLDPTLLLTKDFYKEQLVNKQPPKKNYLFTYILDVSEENNAIVREIQSMLGLDIKFFKVQTAKLDEREPFPPVEEWLSYLYYADYVITDSFHGTIFSILFNKPFITVTNPTRGVARIHNLLYDYGLNNRLLHDVKSLNMDIVRQEINWGEINHNILLKRESSLSFLKECINLGKK